MKKYTSEQRHDIYKKVLEEILEDKKNGHLFFLCPAIRNHLKPGETDCNKLLLEFRFDGFI